jgi:Na+-driven multidrug efflux pump
MSKARFLSGSLSKHITVMATTSALALMATFLTDILTLFYVAKLHDPAALAIVGLAKTLLFLNGSLISAVVMAAGAFISQRAGHGAARVLPSVVTCALLLTLVTTAVIAAFELACLEWVAGWLGAGVIADQTAARHFVTVTVGCSLLACVSQLSAQALRAVGLSRAAMVVVLSGAATLAVADPLCIFVLNLGLSGAALAYGVAMLVAASMGLYQLQRHVGLRLRLRMRLVHLHSRSILRTALPWALANLATPVAVAAMLSQLATHGVSAMAGMAVVDRVLQIAYCFYFALPGALVPVLSQIVGAGDRKRTWRAIRLALSITLGYGLAVWAVLLALAQPIADYFGLTGAGEAIVLGVCQYGAGLWALIGIDFVALSLFISIGRPWWVVLYAWARATLGTLPFIYMGEHFGGAAGVILAPWAGSALVALVAIIGASLATSRYFRCAPRPASLLS